MSRRNSSPVRRDSLPNERSKVGGGTSLRKMNTLVNIYLLPDNRASGQAKCKKVDIDPVFADRFVFQVRASTSANSDQLLSIGYINICTL